MLTGTGLAYRGLWARDARGRELRAWLDAPREGGLAIRVDDRGAAYPLRVDPFFQRAHLTAADGAVNDRMGESVAVAGDTIVVGAPDDDVSGQVDQGTAYVFVKPPTGWADATPTARLRASDGDADDQFGEAVAIDDDTIVVGAPDKPGAYVYVKPAGGWVDAAQNAKLTTNPALPDWADFGHAVAVDNNVVVVGAQYSDAGGARRGCRVRLRDAERRLGEPHPERHADQLLRRSGGPHGRLGRDRGQRRGGGRVGR